MKSNRRYPPTGDAILADTGGLWPPLGAPKRYLGIINCSHALVDSALGNLEGGSECRLVVALGCIARSAAVGALRCERSLETDPGAASASFWDEEFRGL